MEKQKKSTFDNGAKAKVTSQYYEINEKGEVSSKTIDNVVIDGKEERRVSREEMERADKLTHEEMTNSKNREQAHEERE